MGRKGAIGAAIELAYRAVGTSSDWSAVFACLQEVLAADKVGVLTHDFPGGRGEIGYGAGFAPEFRASYARHFAVINPWLRGDAPFHQKRAMTGDEILPYWELARSEFYADWLRPQNIYHAVFGVLSRLGPKLLYLAAHRSMQGPAFNSADKRAVGAIVPHLDRAIALERRLRSESSEAMAMLELLGHLPEAAFLVDRRAQLHASNRAADRLLALRDGLFLVQGCLACASSLQHRALRRLLAAPFAPPEEGGGPHPMRVSGTPSDRIVVSRPSGRAPLLLSILPVMQPIITGLGAREPVRAILTKDPEREPDLSAGELHALYSMTATEARLALLIRDGLSLQDAASRLHISRNTARTHMKNVYAKTGVHRQAGLVRLLA